MWARRVRRLTLSCGGFFGGWRSLVSSSALVLVAGTVGFVATEDASVWDGFLWALDTIATVGSIPAPQTTGGQVVKVVLIVFGVGTLFYALVADDRVRRGRAM